MEPQPPRARVIQTQQQVGETQLHQAAAAPTHLEFESAEQVLRYDASQTQAPETLTARVKESIAGEPPPPKPWWQRWFCRRP
jgi:hypothetical protein